MPLTASVESGQSSPSLRTGGGVTAAVAVGVGAGASCGGGMIGVLTSGFSPGNGVGGTPAGCDCSALVFSGFDEPPVVFTITNTSAATTPITTTAMPNANARRRQ